eukprot:TRINITY_DN1600_c0_g1_i6.p3 TRINITY_DN1600_c0_g1~~TRINITY_DN1600_c0_g1_i6.p3  ORF type:complete len:159 (+),score=25.12 TRINITY_DN1600_c0_g1_i6:129-605(+)
MVESSQDRFTIDGKQCDDEFQYQGMNYTGCILIQDIEHCKAEGILYICAPLPPSQEEAEILMKSNDDNINNNDNNNNNENNDNSKKHLPGGAIAAIVISVLLVVVLVTVGVLYYLKNQRPGGKSKYKDMNQDKANQAAEEGQQKQKRVNVAEMSKIAA